MENKGGRESFLTPETIKKGVTVLLGLLVLAGLVYAAVWAYRNKDRVVSKIPFISSNSESQQNSDESWQEYTNQKYGLRVKHPEEVVVTEEPTGETLLTQTSGDSAVSIELTANRLNGRSVNTVLEETKKEVNQSGLSVHSEELVTTSGRAGYKLEIRGDDNFIYYFYPLGLDSYLEVLDSSKGEESESKAAEIVSSLEFLAPPSGI